MKKKPLLGAHLSIAGGLDNAITHGDSIECTAIQIFTKSNRQWRAKKLTTQDITDFKEALSSAQHVQMVVAHASYLMNLGSPKKETATKSVAALVEELHRCKLLGIPYLIVHPGAHLKTDLDECLQRIAHNLDTALNAVPGKVHVLLETMAGQGSNVCYSFEQIAFIRKQSTHKKRIGVCLDTCHIFAAGYQFDSPASYKKMWKNFDNTIGMQALKVIHINDSQKECDSRVDRHEHIGKGKIGIKAFELIMNDKNLTDVPKILETPKEGLLDDKRNMKKLLDLMKT